MLQNHLSNNIFKTINYFLFSLFLKLHPTSAIKYNKYMKFPVLLLFACLVVLTSAGFPFANDLSKVFNGAKGTVEKKTK